MDGIYSNFISTLNNSISAIRKKRYDLVTIFGNRVLSDLVIIEGSIKSDAKSFLAFTGFLLRRVGFDLLTLSQNARDTARLKQKAVTLISKTKGILSSDVVLKFSKVLSEYKEYIETWANEVNENDSSEYLRNGELDEIIFQWVISALKNVSETQLLLNAHPINAIDNELFRMSYEEKLSERNMVLSISLRELGWLSETTYQVIDMFRTSSFDKSGSLELSSELSKQLVDFSHKVMSTFESWKDGCSKEMKESLIKNIFEIDSEILLSWRKLLNNYYQFQTVITSIPKIKQNEEKESEGEADV